MALIKYGPLATEVSGTVGGVTFARTHNAKACRAWRAPTNKRTVLQVAQRHIASRSSTRWYDVLSAAERQNWDTYAPSCEFTNPLGEAYTLNGFNFYVRNNNLTHLFEGADLTDAPTLTGFPPEWTLTLLLNQSTGALTFTDIDPDEETLARIYFCIHTVRPVTKTFPFPQRLALYVGYPPFEFPYTLYTYNLTGYTTEGSCHALVTWYIVDQYARISTQRSALVVAATPP